MRGSRMSNPSAFSVPRRFAVHLQKCARDRQAHGAGLTGRSATGRVDGEIVGVRHFHRLQAAEARCFAAALSENNLQNCGR